MATRTALRTEHDLQQTTRSLLFGIVLWFVHLNVAYALPSLTCKFGWLSFSVAGLSGLQVVETIITLFTIPLMLLVIHLPWRAWRGFQTEEPLSNPHLLQDTEKDRLALVAFVVTLLNSAFLLFAIASVVPIVVFSTCRPS
jgi:hypothetical protein